MSSNGAHTADPLARRGLRWAVDGLLEGKPVHAMLRWSKPWAARKRRVRVGDAWLVLPDVRHVGIGQELALTGTHEPECTRAYTQTFLQPGQTVMDIGCNIGYYAVHAARTLGPHGRLVCFEPVPELAELARANLEQVATPWEMHAEAITDRPGTVAFHQSEVPNWGSLVQRDFLRGSQTVDVEATSIDAFLEDKDWVPDWVRMDIEGGEAGALVGASRTLAEHRPGLFVEMHGHILGLPATRRIVERLMEAGYDEAWVIPCRFDNAWAIPPVRQRHTWTLPLASLEHRLGRYFREAFSLILRPGT